MKNFIIQKNIKFAPCGAKGFTLVEALVAISILMIAIAAPMTLAQKSLSTATFAKDQMIATFLAQDAIESVRNIRDQIAKTQTTGNWLKGDGTDFLSKCICIDNDTCNFDLQLTVTQCYMDTTKTDWSAYVPTTGFPADYILKISKDTNNNFLRYDYTGSNGGASKFSRFFNIYVNPGGNQNEAKVNVRVSWVSQQGTKNNIDLSDFIYNYSENLQ